MATKAGSKISDTNELKTLKDGDIARIGSDIYRRDLAKEEEIAKTINPADKDAFNKAVYLNTQSSNLDDMEDIMKIGTGNNKEAPGADGSIGADVLKDEEEIDFEEAETPMPIVPEVEEIPEMELTPSEEKEVGLMDEISGLYEETLGRTAYRTELEDEAGLSQMKETQRDLERQLKILANEEQQETLRLQDKVIPNVMISKQTEKMMRQNAIKALGLNSLLEASRGNISTATALVDRTVSAKYDPIEEEISVKERNLQALRNSPQATIEDKNRANKMQILLDEQKTALADARAEKEAVMNLAIEAQKNGADSVLTTTIQEADTRLEALEIGGELLVSGGWKYVSTPAERDRLIAQGYEMTQTGGRTYMKDPEAEEAASAQIGSISEQLKAAEAGYDIIDGKIALTSNQTTPIDTSLSIGEGTITALNGSDFWKPGLDFVLAGGKGADVKSPFVGEVIFVGENGNFGNQVKIRAGSGEEIWLSHLDSINVGVGDQVNAESVVGKQGNTGKTYSTTGGDGTHLDITIKKPDGSFYSAPEVAGLLGYDGGSLEGDVEFPTGEDLLNMNNEERQFVNSVMRQLPTKLKDSEQEKIERQKEALFDYRRGRDIQGTIDEINGFVLDSQVPEPAVDFAKNLRTHASGTDLDLSQIASAVNYGNYTKAMTNVENANLEKADKDFSDLVLTQTIIKRADEATDLLDELGGGYSGVWDDVANRWIIKVPTGAGEEARQKAARIGAILTGINKDIRLRYLGSAVTETEAVFLENFLSTMKDQPEIINTKLKELKADTLSRHNSARNVVNLPSVNEQMIVNNELRLPLYGFEQEVNKESIDNAPIGTMVEAEDGTVYEKTLSGWISNVEIIEPFN